MRRNCEPSAIVIKRDCGTAHRLSRAALAGLALLALVRQGMAAEPAANSSTEDLLAVSGRVLLPDGSPAAGAIVWAVCGNLSAGVALVRADEKGQFRLGHEFGWGSSLNARTKDWSLQASLRVPRESARAMFARPVEIRLSPAREQLVSVTFDNKPVEGAHVVAVDGGNCRVPGLTDRDGRVRLRLLDGDKLTRIAAWHPAFGAGGRLFSTLGAESPAGQTIQLSLFPAKPHTIRVVDGQEQPVPGLELAVNCATTEFAMTRDIEAARVRTDVRGEVLVAWAPRDVKHVNVDLVDPHWKLDTIDTQGGLTTVKILRKHAVKGRLAMPAGANAEGILVTGTGIGVNSMRGMFHTDAPNVRARRDGSFTLLAVPDHGYALGVADSEWASDGWTGVILANENAAPAKIDFAAYPATALTVHVTRGPRHAPVAGAWINVRNGRIYSWKDARGQRHNAGGGSQSGLQTDENGIARFAVGKGKLSVSLYLENWNDERSIEVDSAKPVAVDFDRPWTSKRTISGRLTLKQQPHKRGPSTIVRAWSTKEPKIRGEGVVLPDGRFTIDIDAEDVHVLAIDSSERLSGARQIGLVASTIDLELAPMGSCSGTVVDRNGKPLGGHGVELVFKGPGFMDFIVIDSAACDDKGRFRFDAVPAQMALQLFAGAPASARAAALSHRSPAFRIDSTEEFYLNAGEVRENVRLEAEPANDDGRPSGSGKSRDDPMEVHLKRAARDVRLAGMRLLVVLQGDSSKSVKELTDRIVDADEPAEMLRYLPITIFPERAATKALISRLGWERPKPGEIELVTIDDKWRQTAALRLSVGHNAVAEQQAAEFIKRNAPARRDAKAFLAAARQEARDTGRRLCIVESGPRCGPCFVLARWLDDQHELLAKDYVILKVLENDEHAREVIDKLNPPRGAGIPWYAITEPDGTILATSDGPLGNSGYPDSVEGKRHLKTMLDRTARRLTAAERDRLVQSVSEHGP